jgi:hydroxyacylglutathione hydrolase
VPIIGPLKDDQFWINLLPEQYRQFGFEGSIFSPHQWLDHGDTVSQGNLTFDVVYCSEHTPGNVVFVEKAQQFSAVGDVIFKVRLVVLICAYLIV